MRLAGRALVVGAALALAGTRASAQSCHTATEERRDETGFGFALRGETASFRTPRYEGHFEGAFAGAHVAVGRFVAAASLPYYRLLKNGLATTGPGDVALGARARLLEGRDPPYSASATLSATLPTGSEKDELGMGHPMLAAGLGGRLRTVAELELRAELAYARALAPAGGHHAHEGGTSPLVEPMNASELAPLVTVSRPLGGPFALRAGAYGGFPLGTKGSSRLVGLLGVQVARGRFGARVEGQAPLAGAPFDEKLLLELSLAL